MIFEWLFYFFFYYDSLQVFIIYLLFGNNGLMVVFILVGDFYIGWEQVLFCDYFDCILVGFDCNFFVGSLVLFFNNDDEGWQFFLEGFLLGFLMLCLVMGNEWLLSFGIFFVEVLDFDFCLYFNLVQECVYICIEGECWLEDYCMQFVNLLGQGVLDQVLVCEFGLNEFWLGMYIVKVYDLVMNWFLYCKFVIIE